MDIALPLVQALGTIPAPLATLLLAALPFGELRGSLPVALTIYNMSIPEAAFWSILGNMLPVYFLLVFYEQGSAWLSQRSPKARQFFDWLFDNTRRRMHNQVAKYGVWALTIFVAVPLPITGAWTGSVAAFVFGLPKGKAFLAILGGVIVAAVIVTAVTTGAVVTVRTLL
jgi:uncharacterized membrane protein